MSFIFENLDDETRGYMLAELDEDLLAGRLFHSPRLTPAGAERYPALLREAIERGSPTTLEAALRLLIRRTELRRMREVSVPHTAARLIAEGEFNRYYIRGLCGRVLGEGGTSVHVYRARPSAQERSASQAIVGRALDAQELLDDLRRHCDGSEPSLLPMISSGLSVRIPD